MAIAAEGARVAFAARRVERLEEIVAEAGGDSIAVACDVRDEASCHAAVDSAVSAFGGLDALVYSPGISSFGPIEEIDAKTWREVLDTNLVGPSLVTNAAIEHLEASRGKALYFSSIVIDDSPPRPDQASYVVSKVALEALIKAWQGEHRRVSFTALAMGDTVSEFASGVEMAKIARIVQRWVEQGYMYGRAMDAADVAEQVVHVLASRETVRRVAFTPRYPDDLTIDQDLWAETAVEQVRDKAGR
jgi:NAD(P)-dependent dehydrogenase (short-subunit alcohol dehydrogenase family)